MALFNNSPKAAITAVRMTVVVGMRHNQATSKKIEIGRKNILWMNEGGDQRVRAELLVPATRLRMLSTNHTPWTQPLAFHAFEDHSGWIP